LICGKFIQLFLKGVVMNEKILSPVKFNAHKHHFRFLLNEIETWKTLDWKQVESKLLGIGENLLDFYTGELSVENICEDCIHYFNSKKINDIISFSDWLNPYEYRKIVLKDSSEWVIKNGNDPGRYIHIHPAKQSPHTIRVRAATLKTVVALMIKNTFISMQMNENLQTVNNIRTTYLQLSSIKSLQHGKGILKLWEHFDSHYRATLPFN
jgi:hypothetical protein